MVVSDEMLLVVCGCISLRHVVPSSIYQQTIPERCMLRTVVTLSAYPFINTINMTFSSPSSSTSSSLPFISPNMYSIPSHSQIITGLHSSCLLFLFSTPLLAPLHLCQQYHPLYFRIFSCKRIRWQFEEREDIFHHYVMR